MKQEKTTTIRVSHTVWLKLNSMKLPNDTFDDILQKILFTDEPK